MFTVIGGIFLFLAFPVLLVTEDKEPFWGCLAIAGMFFVTNLIVA